MSDRTTADSGARDRRAPAVPDLSANAEGLGRELFAAFRAHAAPVDQGAGIVV